MADNIKVTEGTGPKVATDEVEIDGATAHVQRVKPVIGAAGSGVDVSSANPMPISDNAGSLTVDGTVAVSALSGELPEGTKALGKVKVSVLEGEPKVKIAESQTVGLVAGTAEVGKIKVTELPATPTGTNSIGKVKSIEEAVTLTGEPKVKISENAALVAGAAAIGTVKVTVLEGEPKVKVATIEGEPKVKVSALEGEPKVKAIGDVASGSEDSGSPVKTGAVARTALPAAVSTGQRVNNQADKYGRQIFAIAPADTYVSGRVTLENETSTEVIAAPGAGIRLVITSILVTNASATAARVEILDEATAKLINYAAKEGGGWSLTNEQGLFIATTNKPVKAKALATSKIDVFICGYKLPE